VTFLARPPRAPLADVVELLWACEREAVHWERVLPTVRPQLLVRRTADRVTWVDGDGLHRASGAVVSGPFAEPIAIDASEQDGVLGVVFRPGGLAAFSDLSVRGLAGRHASVREVLPGLVARLDSLRRLPLEVALDALEAALVGMRREQLDRGLLRAMALLERPRSRVAGVADALGWSTRTLSRRFGRSVGLSPKAYARIQRFRRAVEHLDGPADLTGLALAHGYADHAHFTHDFRALAGMTPSDWRVADRPYATHATLDRRP
jgi:AraC-like DNA-binding protein